MSASQNYKTAGYEERAIPSFERIGIKALSVFVQVKAVVGILAAVERRWLQIMRFRKESASKLVVKALSHRSATQSRVN